MTVHDKVIAIIAEQALLDPRDVQADSLLADLGIDSLSLVEAIFAIEEAFDISVPFNANDPDRAGLPRGGRNARLGARRGRVGAGRQAGGGRHDL